MKRIDLIRHLEEHGITGLREGSSHNVYVNRKVEKHRSFLAIEKSILF